MEYPKLFDDQPEITPEVLQDLEDRGLLVPEKRYQSSERRECYITNPTAGEVVCYTVLAKKFKEGAISQEDARLLLVIESTRKKGPRETNISRLLANAFVYDKTRIFVEIQQWAKSHK